MSDESSNAPHRLLPPLEALLFSTGRPISLRDLAQALEAPEEDVEAALAQLKEQSGTEGRGIVLEQVAGGWRFASRPEHDGLLRKYFEISERSRLSLAALETLALIAYRQPITAPEISEIRGVNSAGVLKTLFDRKLITTAGRKPVVGTPFLYRTTREFLVRFGLNEIAELPRLEELDADVSPEILSLASPAREALLEPAPEEVAAGASPEGE